jgi:outer membrane protein
MSYRLKTFWHRVCATSLEPSLKPIVFSVALTAMAVSPMVLAQPVDDDAWHVSVGIGVTAQPKYPGSSETRTGAIPVFNASKGALQIGALPGFGVPLGVGYTVLREGPWRLGLGIGTSLGSQRTSSDGDALSRLGEIKQTLSGAVSGSYTEDAVNASASVISDLGGQNQGTHALLDVFFRAKPIDKWALHAGPGITLMDKQYAQTFYGVTSAQSTSSGYAVHSASAGVSALRFGAGAVYEMTREWSLGAQLSVSKLQGDAAKSPAVENSTQTGYGIFTNYRF